MSEFKFSHSSQVNFDNLEELKRNNRTFLLGKTGYAFLDDHFGLRPGCMHVIHSRRSSGKTSLVRSLLVNLSMENRVLWYASEENQEQWKLKFEREKLPSINNIRFISEKDLCHPDQHPDEALLLKTLAMHIDSFEAKILILDNLTTSQFYNDKKTDVQNKIVMQLKFLMQEKNCALLMVVHDNGDPRGEIISSNNVRGSKTVANIAEYWYNMHRLRLSDVDAGGRDVGVSIVHVEKCRAHDTSDTAYQLTFNKQTGYYVSDKPVGWAIVKELLKNQIKLTVTKK